MNHKSHFSPITKLILTLLVTGAIVLILFVAGAFGETTISTTITTNPDLERGLVGHWTFDGKDLINNATDRSGQGNDGFLNGTFASATTTVIGKIGQALDFNGTDDYVSIPSVLNSTAGAVVLWFKTPSVLSGDHYPFGSAFNNNNRVYIGTVDGSDFFARLAGSSDFASASVSINTWYHAALIWRADATGEIYLDGVSVGTTTLSWGENPKALAIGRVSNGTVHWNGLTDDVRTYNRALSPDEISRLYQLGATTHIATTITTNPDLERGLVGHWTFDGKDMNPNVRDRSGQGNHGNLINFTSTTTVIGRIGQALEFDGVDDHVLLDSVISSNDPRPISISVWAKTDTTSKTIQSVFFNEDAGSPNLYVELRRVSGTTYRMRLYSDGYDSSADTFTLDTNWHHYTWLWFSDDSINYYRDGVSVGSGTKSFGDNGDGIASIGNTEALGGGFEFDGAIDDVRIYNRTLSSDEISRLYQLGATTHIATSITTNPDLERGLVGHWTFDGSLNSTITDRSGNANHGYLSGVSTSSAVRPGKIGQALDFDGSDDFVDVGTAAILDITPGTDPATLSVWVKAGDQTHNFSVVAGDWNGLTQEFGIWISDTIEIGGFVGGDINSFDTGVNLSGEWQHIVIRTDATTAEIFVDAVQKAQDLSLGTEHDTTQGFIIGYNKIEDRYFDGIIDDVRFYDRALSSDEISRLYNLGR